MSRRGGLCCPAGHGVHSPHASRGRDRAMAAKQRYFMGLYSGAAGDGVDAAVAAVQGRRDRMKVRQVLHVHAPYEPELRNRLARAVRGESASLGELASLDREIGLAFAAAGRTALDRADLAGGDVVAVGVSGQVVRRLVGDDASAPGPACVVGEPAIVAAGACQTVVGGFSSGLAASGGVGSPTDWPEWLLLRDKRLSRAVVHLGGIASLTFVSSAAQAADVVSFDIGPGTTVIDQIAERVLDRDIDEDGASAARGAVSEELVNELLAHSYLHAPWPKRCSPHQWGAVYVDRVLSAARERSCDPDGIVASVTEVVSRATADAVGRLTERPHEVVLTGGGARNIHLAGRIRSLLSPCSTYASLRYGMDLQAWRAVCYAVLAAARVDGARLAFAGAGCEVVLGAVVAP